MSLRAVAEEVGSTLPVLCREVGDRDGLVVAMLDAVAEDIVVPPPEHDPHAELVALALAVHDALLPDPWAVTALAVDGLAGPLILPVPDRVFAAFRAAVVPEGEVAVSSQVLWDHVFGAVLSAARAGTFSRCLVDSAYPDATHQPLPHHDRVRRGVEILAAGLISP